MDFSPAILDEKAGTVTLPSGQTIPTVNGSTTTNGNGNTHTPTNGTTTPSGSTPTKPSTSTSQSHPLPIRSDPSFKNPSTGTFGVKSGLAQMLKGGVIMDVMNVEQAKIAEASGAVSVMALERIPSLIRSQGGIARMSDPAMIKAIIDTVSIPVMAKVRIGHFVEAQILQAIGVDYIDESEVLTMADDVNHIHKAPFKTPFVCGAKNLGEALRRISEGAAMIRCKGEAGSGNVIEAVKHVRTLNAEIRKASTLSEEELYTYAKEISAPYHLLKETARLKRLPVVMFAAGGIATPADAALMMQLGCDGVFVGSGIFASGDPALRAKAIVQATTHYNNPKILAEVSTDLGIAMSGVDVADNMPGGRMAGKGN